PKGQAGGPIYPSMVVAYGLAHALTMLAKEPTPRQKELEAFAARMRGDAGAPAFTGNKQFWCSDYMAQRRKDYFTSVKMLSVRMLNAELVNSEGKKSVHLSDGANFLYLTGDEYLNIFPVWDWTKIPGTTAIQGTLETGEPKPIHARGKSTFDGGVSDGTYGMAAMDLDRGNLTAKKAWFFFDRSYVALGAGITLANDAQHSVATDVNQPLLEGDVLTSQSQGPLAEGTYSYDSPSRVWAYHDHVGYIFAPGTKIHLSAGPQTGRWSDIGTGANALVTENVFDLWIDNGKQPLNASYEYTVLPDVTAGEVARRAKSARIDVLANTPLIQAVYNRTLKLAEIAFRAPGSLKTPVGKVKTNHACLLLVRRSGDGWSVTASDPENEPLALTVTVRGKKVAIDLPGGNFAGSSVTKELQ
ncbi:MAG: polysaccharide lyase family 8 super-sandwich domain-containing protein, partial [Terracidiphilus sp.]